MALSNPRREAVFAAARRHNVPLWVLGGVWDAETSMGTNVKTSSAGAVGDFQFIPGTAARYGYPQTNTPNAQQFAGQADSAAHYLADLYRQTGSWDKALRAYSGGGYGEDHVRDSFSHGWWGQSAISTGVAHAADPVVKPVAAAVSSTGDALATIGKTLGLVFSVRGLELLIALAAGIMGLVTLAKSIGSPLPHVPKPI